MIPDTRRLCCAMSVVRPLMALAAVLAVSPLRAQSPPPVIEHPIGVVWGSYRNNEDLVDGGASQWSFVQQHMDAYLLHGAYWNVANSNIGSPSPDVVGPKLAALVNAQQKKVILEHGLAGLYPDVDSAFGASAAGSPSAAASFSSGIPSIKRLVNYGFPVPDISTDYIMEAWKQSVRFHPEWTSREFFTALTGSWETYNGSQFNSTPGSSDRNTYGWFRQWVEGLAAAYPGIRVTSTNSPVYFNWDEGGVNRRELGGDLNNFFTWLKLERRGDEVTALYSGDGKGWKALGSSTVSLGGSPVAGMFVSSLDGGRLAQARFDNIRVLPCYFADIGKTGVGGNLAISGSTYTLTASGNESIHPGNNTTDAQFLAWKDWSGDGTFTVRLDSLVSSNPNRTNPSGEIASAGLMIRESSASNSRQLSLLANFANQLEFLSRTSTGGGLAPVSGSGSPIAGLGVGSTPRWLRLSRTGNSVSASHSLDGVAWTSLGASTVTLPSKIQIGIFADSQVRNEEATAVFTNADFLTPLTTSFGGSDIGSAGAGSTSSLSGSTYTLKARGSGLAGTTDSARLHATPLSGDGSFVARLAYFAADTTPATALSAGAQMGLTLRTDNSAGSAHTSICFTPQLGLRALSRPSSAATTTEFATYGVGEVSVQALGTNYRPLLHYFTGNDFMKGLHEAFPGTFSQNFAGFTTDSPYAGYQKWGGSETHADALKHREKIILYERWLQNQGREHQFIANSSGSSDFGGFDTATQAGRDAWDLLYKQQSLRSIQLHQLEGGRPDKVIFESWYSGPYTMVPETQEGTFTNLAAHGIRYLKGVDQNLDLSLRATDEQAFAGELVYQNSPVGSQVREWRTPTDNGSRSFVVRLTNRGTVEAYPVIHAHETGAAGWGIAYSVSSSDVGSAIRSSTGLKLTDSTTRGSELIAPGASVDLTINITANSPVDPRDILIRAFWNPQDPTLAVRDSLLLTLLPANDPPVVFQPAFATTPPATPVDVDLRTLVADVESTGTQLAFETTSATGGTVQLLADGFTARFSPTAGAGKNASFSFSVRDQWADARLLRHYRFESPDETTDNLASDSSSSAAHGELSITGAGSAVYQDDRPPAFPSGESRSLRLTEVDATNHARLRTSLSAASLNLTTSDWSTSFWFKRASHANSDFLFYIGSGNGLSGEGHELELIAGSGAGLLSLNYYDNTNTRIANLVTSAGLPVNTWHHAALVWQANGAGPGTMTLYVNGLPAGAATFTAAFKQTSPIVFGGVNSGAADPRQLNGWLDDVAIYQTALPAQEILDISRRPVANQSGELASGSVQVLIDPLSAGLGGHWPFDVDFNDHSGLARHLAATGGALIGSAPAKQGAAALQLGISGAHAISSNALDLGAVFTLSAWIHLPAGATSIRTIASNSGGGFNTDGFRFFVNTPGTTDGKLILEAGNGTLAGIVSSMAGVVLTDRWQHVAAVVDRSAGTAVLYRNGQSVASGAVRNDFSNNAVLRAGSMAGGNSLRGTIDDLRLFSRALSAPELGQIASISNTPPSLTTPAPLTLTAGTTSAALAIAVDDAESGPDSLVLSATSSDESILPNANIVLGGSGASRTITLTPVAWGGGPVTVDLTVTDGLLLAQSSFVLTVTNTGHSALWTATGNASPLPWTTAPNWLLARPPFPGNVCEIDILTGVGVPAGIHVSHQDRASPFAASRLTLGGNAVDAAEVVIQGGALSLVGNGTGTPSLVLSANAPLVHRIAASVQAGGTLNISGNGSGTFEIPGVISGTASGAIVKAGSSSLMLGGANTFTGGIDITSGTLRITHGGALGTPGNNTLIRGGSALAAVEIAGNITSAEPFRIDMQNTTGHAQLRNVSGNNTLTGAIALNGGGSRWEFASLQDKLTITGHVSNIVAPPPVSPDTWRTLYLRGPGSGLIEGDLRQTATSRLNLTVLSGDWTIGGNRVFTDETNAFTGPTTVSGGSLTVNKDLKSNITVQATGTFGGNGATTGTLTIQSSSRLSSSIADWNSPPAAFAATQLIGTGATGWTVRLDASGLANFTEAPRTIPVIAAGSLVNVNPAAALLDIVGFPGLGTWSLQTTSGALQLVYQPDIYQNWTSGVAWNGRDSSPAADPDGDGLENLLEFALGGDPLTASTSPLPVPSIVSGRLRLTFQRIADPLLLYQVEAANDVSSPVWSVVWSSTGSANTAGSVIVDDELLAPAPVKRFLRLKVSR